MHVGGCQNSGPLNTRCRIMLRTPKGTIILINIHVTIDPMTGLQRYPRNCGNAGPDSDVITGESAFRVDLGF